MIKSRFLSGSTRIVLYALGVFLLAEFMKWDAEMMPTDNKFSEESCSEYLQVVFLFLTSMLLGFLFLKSRNFKYTALLFFGFTSASLLREMDAEFDKIYVGAWQIPVYLLIIPIVYVVFKNRTTFLKEIERYFATSSFGLFIGGFLTTFVFSRLYGRKIFWHAVMEDKYLRVVKNAAEEGIELFGYLLILLSVIEFFFVARVLDNLAGDSLEPPIIRNEKEILD